MSTVCDDSASNERIVMTEPLIRFQENFQYVYNIVIPHDDGGVVYLSTIMHT